MNDTIQRPAELAQYPLPAWATEGGEWVPPLGPTDQWDRFARRKFGEFIVDEYQTWSPTAGYKTFGLQLTDTQWSDQPLQDEEGYPLIEQVRRFASDLLKAAEFLESLATGTK